MDLGAGLGIGLNLLDGFGTGDVAKSDRDVAACAFPFTQCRIAYVHRIDRSAFCIRSCSSAGFRLHAPHFYIITGNCSAKCFAGAAT